MTTPRETESPLFLTTLTLPVHTTMVRFAVACADQVADMLHFTQQDRYQLEMAVEEAFCNSVTHFSGPASSDERIHLEFFVERGTLVTSIRERGIPFDRGQAQRYTPDSLEHMDSPGLGMLLMHQGMDQVELFVHGREGKETRLSKRLRYGALPDELLALRTARRSHRITVAAPEIRMPAEEELPAVRRLAWRCYGYTQEALLYDLEALTAKYRSGEFVPAVAVDPASGELIGHIGLKYHDPACGVPEMGLAFLDPTYRCPGVMGKLSALLLDQSRQRGDRGIFDCSVTTHTHSQRDMEQFCGAIPCGLLMGIAASGMQVKELATSRQEKGSVVNHYIVFDRSPRTVYPPAHHRAMIEEIYGWLDLPRASGAAADPVRETTCLSVFPLPDELNVSFLIVHAIGKDIGKAVADGLRQCRQERRDAVYAFLPLGDPATPFMVEQCEANGLCFAGIMPHIHDGDDRIIMQWLAITLDPDAIRVYGDKGQQLKSYILAEQARVQG